jgi:hypothetical protein
MMMYLERGVGLQGEIPLPQALIMNGRPRGQGAGDKRTNFQSGCMFMGPIHH